MRMRNDSNPLSLIFSVILQSKELPSCVSTGDQALFTQRGSSIILCFALRLLVVVIENTRNPIEARNGGLPHSSLPKRRIFEYKDTNFWSKYTLFKFLKLNQRISASVQGTPRRGNEHIAQGIALGYVLAGPSARSLNACQLQVNTCACLNDLILEEQKKREAAP